MNRSGIRRNPSGATNTMDKLYIMFRPNAATNLAIYTVRTEIGYVLRTAALPEEETALARTFLLSGQMKNLYGKTRVFVKTFLM